jgi:hypothetical protein
LQERDADTLAVALNHSPLTTALTNLASPSGACSIKRFERQGFNRSRIINMRWQGFPDGWKHGHPVPVEALASAEVPGGYGQAATHLRFILDVTVRLSGWFKTLEKGWVPVGRPQSALEEPGWRISVPQLEQLLDTMIEALTNSQTVTALAGLAEIDPMAVPQPRVLHLATRRPAPDILDTTGLRAIPEAGSSYGANVLADPALDLADPTDRQEQVRAWLVQTALDAGLLGMEKLLANRASSTLVAP